MCSALIGGLLPCAACCVVGLRWLADVSCACVPLLVSCSGFGLPMHAQLLRLFVTHGLNSDMWYLRCPRWMKFGMLEAV